MDKLLIPKARHKRSETTQQIRISTEMYEKIGDIADETGRSFCNVATPLLEFAVERAEVVCDEKTHNPC